MLFDQPNKSRKKWKGTWKPETSTEDIIYKPKLPDGFFEVPKKVEKPKPAPQVSKPKEVEKAIEETKEVDKAEKQRSETDSPVISLAELPKVDLSKTSPVAKSLTFASTTAPKISLLDSKSDEPVAPKFSFGATATKESSSESKPPPAFLFGASDTKPTETTSEAPKFSFGASDATEKTTQKASVPAEAPKFSFGAPQTAPKADIVTKDTKSVDQSKTPAFSFGQPDNQTKLSDTNPSGGATPNPSFSFGSKPTETTGVPKLASETPQFSFGAIEKKETSTPSFSFGASQTPPQPLSQPTTSKSGDQSAPTFSFGQTETKKTDQTAPPSFSFGATTAATSEPKAQPASTPSTFSFGNTVQSEQNKSGFSFGAPQNENKLSGTSTFSFGSQSTQQSTVTPSDQTKPSFSFGNTEKKSDTFSFGAPQNQAQPTGGFSFGSGKSETKPSMFQPTPPTNQNSSNQSSIFGAASTTTTAPTSGGIFGNVQNKNTASSKEGFNFGGKTNVSNSFNFGSQKSTTQAPGSAFGSGGSSSSTFGTSTPTSGFAFGETKKRAGGIFGAKPALTSTNSAPSQSSSSGIFGAASAPAPSGIFGATTTTASTGSGGIFGATPSTTSGSGIFGNSATPFNPSATSTPFGLVFDAFEYINSYVFCGWVYSFLFIT